jgi:hypothetical protein
MPERVRGQAAPSIILLAIGKTVQQLRSSRLQNGKAQGARDHRLRIPVSRHDLRHARENCHVETVRRLRQPLHAKAKRLALLLAGLQAAGLLQAIAVG